MQAAPAAPAAPAPSWRAGPPAPAAHLALGLPHLRLLRLQLLRQAHHLVRETLWHHGAEHLHAGCGGGGAAQAQLLAERVACAHGVPVDRVGAGGGHVLSQRLLLLGAGAGVRLQLA
jgi:hypothetical protein